MIKETGEFVINLTTEELAYATDYCGVKSGKDEDKFKNASLTKEPAKYVKAPLIKESPVNIECQVTDVVPCGSHDMFVAKVLCVHADKNIWTKMEHLVLKRQSLLYILTAGIMVLVKNRQVWIFCN